MKEIHLNNKVRLNDLWLKAAVTGGLWASIEIIIGSFLHNTRIPFAGSILAFSGTVLLIGFYQIWPERGMIIRAGFITAIMKSISPSAIILGPMTGILLEAALIELVILTIGNNLVSFMVAGFLSLSSALFHKIFSLLIFYGFDLIQIYVNIFNFALKQFGLNEAEASEILMALLSVYFVFGVLAGVIGYNLGRKATKMKLLKSDSSFDEKLMFKDFFVIDKNAPSNLGLLYLHLLIVPFGLFFLNSQYYFVGLIVIITYVIGFGFYYRSALRRLRKPVFWMQLLIIVLLSAIFYKGNDLGVFWLSKEGLMVGLEMMLRAIFIVVAFSAISVELRNEKVRNFLYRIGFGKFYQSVGLAFGALPMMIAMLPESKKIIRHPIKSLIYPLAMADRWLLIFKEKSDSGF